MDVAHGRCLRVCALASLLILAACGSTSENSIINKNVELCSGTAVPNQFLVKWKSGLVTRETAENRDVLERDLAAATSDQVDYIENDHLVHLEEPMRLEAATALTTPDYTWGQTRVEAPEAWTHGVHGDGVIVAVIDSGVDATHPQLKNQLAVNPGEIVDGIDNDHNGYIDDVNGWDFSKAAGVGSGSRQVSDDAGHGTHVSGIILADPTQGAVQGIAPKAKLLPLRFMDGDGNGYISSAILAVNYAASRGARVVNASWGGSNCSQLLRESITNLGKKGILFVAASGNGNAAGLGQNLDIYPVYPAAYGIDNQLTVGSSGASDVMSGFSNFSTTFVHLLAPGEQIFSTWPGGGTAVLDGTSMATPFVSGAAALLWSYRPTATLQQIRTAILSSVDPFSYPTTTGGRLNIKNALAALTQIVPAEQDKALPRARMP